MLNDRNDKFEGQDDSEYHFSDDEVSYELEDESSKSGEMTAESGREASASKESLIERLTKSKRMLGSVAVFAVLVLVVYKMVVPSSGSAPSTEIVAASTSTPGLMSQQAAPSAQQPVQTAAQAPGSSPMSASPAQPAAQPVVTVVPATQPAEMAQSQMAAQAQQALPALPNNAMPASAQPMVQQAMSAAQSMVQQATTTAATASQGMAAPAQPLASMPSVIPVPTPATSTIEQAQSTASGYVVPSAGIDEKIAAVSANSERLMGQLQGQYTQQFNEFSNQNRAVQDQIQALTARVSVIENQLNQLIQALTKRNAGASLNAPTRLEQPQSQASEAKIAYNVQAIIPGRAWLKSDNGETLTVAEGDSIKGVGRVTKIDPYDGVVEINTGSKSVSLSYGESA